MKKLKRVAWFCFAGCCCAGLMLVAGERFQSAKTDTIAAGSGVMCPMVYYGQYNGTYYFAAWPQGQGCQAAYGITDTQMHQVGDCETCPDPIVTDAHPIPLTADEASLVPQPDPLFSGVLR